jgi:hypothetical protein
MAAAMMCSHQRRCWEGSEHPHFLVQLCARWRSCCNLRQAKWCQFSIARLYLIIGPLHGLYQHGHQHLPGLIGRASV